MEPTNLTKNASQFRWMATGYRVLKPAKAGVYAAAARALEQAARRPLERTQPAAKPADRACVEVNGAADVKTEIRP